MGLNSKQHDLWQPWKSSEELAAGSGTIKATAGVVGGFLIYADGTNDVTLDVKDNTTTLLSRKLDTSVEGMGVAVIIGNPGVLFGTSIKYTVTGTNGKAIVLYR